jgi:hypothetical protein
MGVSVVREGGRLGHDSPVMLVNARGEIVRRYTDTAHVAARLIGDIRAARAGSTTRDPGI